MLAAHYDAPNAPLGTFYLSICLLWWIVADKIDSFGPNLPPHIHVVTQVDGTTDPTARGPNQLQQGDIYKSDLPPPLRSHDQMVQAVIGYLGIVSTNWAWAFEGAIGVTLLRVWEGEIFHFIIPGLHVEGGGSIPGSKYNRHHLPFQRTLVLCMSHSVWLWSKHAKEIRTTTFIRIFEDYDFYIKHVHVK